MWPLLRATMSDWREDRAQRIGAALAYCHGPPIYEDQPRTVKSTITLVDPAAIT